MESFAQVSETDYIYTMHHLVACSTTFTCTHFKKVLHRRPGEQSVFPILLPLHLSLLLQAPRNGAKHRVRLLLKVMAEEKEKEPSLCELGKDGGEESLGDHHG